MDSKLLMTVQFPSSGIDLAPIQFFTQVLQRGAFSVDGFTFTEQCLAVQPCEYICLMGAKIWTDITGLPYRLGMKASEDNGKRYICCPPIEQFYRDHLQQKTEGFVQWEYAINKALKGSESDRDTSIVIVDNIHTLSRLKGYVQQTGVYCFDWETTGLDWFRDDFGVMVLSVSFQAGSSYVLPFSYVGETQQRQFLNFHTDMMRNPKIIKVAHNAAFDLLVNRSQGVMECYGPLFDTMLLSHTLDENRKHGLKELITTYFPAYAGYATEGNWQEKDLIKLATYAGTDTDLTIRLFYALKLELYKEQSLTHLYHTSVIPDLLTLVEMQWKGMPVNEKLIDESIEEFSMELEVMDAQMMSFPEMVKFIKHLKFESVHIRVQELEKKLQTAKGRYKAQYEQELNDIRTGAKMPYAGFNLGSPKQLSEFLYGKQGLNLNPVMIKGDLKESTAKDALQDVDHPFTKLLTARRSVAQMISTFMEGLKKRVYNGRVYSSFNIHTVGTGRLSSSKPNLQNIPARTDSEFEVVQRAIKRIKMFFVPAENETLFQFDYSQAELRVMAHYSEEEKMIEAYRLGKDLHAITAANNMHISLEEFYLLDKDTQKQKRHHAKGTNFGLIYGQGPLGYKDYLKKNYGIEVTIEYAEQEHAGFFRLYPNIVHYHKAILDFAERTGYVTTLLGRRRRLPEIHSRNKAIAAHARNAAVNAPIQGTAGEMMRMCLTLLRYRGLLDCSICNSVHDSLMALIWGLYEKQTVKQIIYTAENLPLDFYYGVQLLLPMKMDVEASKLSWGQLAEYEI